MSVHGSLQCNARTSRALARGAGFRPRDATPSRHRRHARLKRIGRLPVPRAVSALSLLFKRGRGPAWWNASRIAIEKKPPTRATEEATMSSVKPFTINVPQSKLDDLRERLERTIWPSTIAGQSYGGPELAQIQALAKRAATMNWRQTEAELNQLPH